MLTDSGVTVVPKVHRVIIVKIKENEKTESTLNLIKTKGWIYTRLYATFTLKILAFFLSFHGYL